jgi:hypothetical protein
MVSKKLRISFKVLFGLLGLFAVATEVVTLIGRESFVPANFFSFFTIQSNIFIAIMFLVSAYYLFKGRQPSFLPLLRGAAALYIVTTGIVFSLLLSGLDANILTAVPWDNAVLHYIIPIVGLIDWLIDPPENKISFKKASIWLVYPIAYVIYSLIRGAIIGWYPYPFLNPATNGYIGIAITTVGIAAVVLGFTWVFTRVYKRRAI